MRIERAPILGMFLIAVLMPITARAGGFLWLGAEFAGEGNIYRYNLATNTIDLVSTPTLPVGGSHWNNMSTDGVNLYIGTPTTQYVGIADIYTGMVAGSVTYSPSLPGHKEDGAFHAATGRLWRTTYSGYVHEVTTGGALVSTYTGVGSLVGLEWVGETLYATDYNGGQIGTITFNQSAAAFNPIPWAAGAAPSGSTDALAYDAQAGVLYMVAGNNRLYTVTFAAGTASANLLVILGTLGYPSSGLVDGMGWVAPQCAATPVQITAQPQNQAVCTGCAAIFSVTATGTEPLSYQWRKAGAPLSDGGGIGGSMTSTLTIDPADAGDEGLYDCIVSNVCGSAESADALLTVGPVNTTGGFLWLGAEYAGEGNIYRYNVDTGVIDRIVAVGLPPGAEHWNNMATDGFRLYLGNPNTQFLGTADGQTGSLLSSAAYSPSLSGRFEDGAYNPVSGNLWRVTFNGFLHETTTSGVRINTYSVTGGLVGLEWVGATLYATNFGGGDVGTITLSGTTGTFNEIPWTPGAAPTGSTDALAFDSQQGILYLVADNNSLYTVTFAAGMAQASLVVDLDTVGYPSAGLIDGLGWISFGCRGDMNCDGTINVGDVDPFAFALIDPSGYSAQYPSCAVLNGDGSGDGIFDGLDIQPFIDCLTP